MSEKINQYAKEYKFAVNDISREGVKLKNPYDRVRICFWIQKLNTLRDDVLEEVRIKNEYIQYLRTCLKGVKTLPMPFSQAPPQCDLVPLAECLANNTADAVKNVPRTGKLQPIIGHKSNDDRAFISVKRSADGGIFCYMCVSPDTMTAGPNDKI